MSNSSEEPEGRGISDEELPEDLRPTEDEETAAHDDPDPEETAGQGGLDPENATEVPDDPLPEG
jgi:hypothetical protein